MDIADELQKLQQLQESGALNGEEFARAKQAILNGTPPARASSSEGDALGGGMFGGRKVTLGDAANRYVSFQIVMAVIGLIVFLLFFFLFFLPQWNRFPRP